MSRILRLSSVMGWIRLLRWDKEEKEGSFFVVVVVMAHEKTRCYLSERIPG